jgi:hypothetical protein
MTSESSPFSMGNDIASKKPAWVKRDAFIEDPGHFPRSDSLPLVLFYPPREVDMVTACVGGVVDRGGPHCRVGS